MAEDDTVWLSAEACEVDGRRLRELSRIVADAETAALEEAVSRFSGPFLADLEIADAYRFESWRVAEEKSLAQARAAVFQELLRRHAASPEATVRLGHLWIQQDPLDQRPHAAVVEALTALGRKREALGHFERCAQMLRRHGAEPGPALEKARVAVGRLGVDGARVPGADSPRAVRGMDGPRTESGDAHQGGRPARPALAGRQREMDRFLRLADHPDGKLQLLYGEPGIGKSRLLDEMGSALAAKGWTLLRGRAFEAEQGRALGPWIDAALAAAGGGTGAAADCPLLRPGRLPEGGQAEASALFEAVREWLEALGRSAPLALLLDDIQWLDASSVALLQYLLRSPAPPFRLAVAGLRSVGAPREAPVEPLLRLLRREGWDETWEIGPLNEAETAALLRIAGSRRDPRDVFARSGGHPLAALAFAHEGGDAGKDARASLETMLDERIRLAGEDGRQVLQWASLLGRGLPPALLETLLDMPVHALLSSLERLEAHGLMRVEEAQAGQEYLFGHDLIRQRAQATLSAPRRTRMHAHVAEILRRHPTLSRGWEEVADHAERGELWETAAEARMEAAHHCGRLRAYGAVLQHVERGLALCDRLGGHWGMRREFCMQVNSSAMSAEMLPPGLEERVQNLIPEARAADHAEAVLAGCFAIAAIRFVQDQPAEVLAAAIQAEGAGDAAEPGARVHLLGGMVTCLLATDLDIPRARRMLAEADRLCAQHGLDADKGTLASSRGWLAYREGRPDEARRLLEQGASELRRLDLPQFEHQLLTIFAWLELEAGRPAAVHDLAARMQALGPVMRQAPDAHFPEALAALARYALGEPGAEAVLDASVEKLRAAKVMTSYLLLFRSELDLRAGRRLEAIPARCGEAIERCEPLGRISEPAWARCLLGLTALRAGRREEAKARLDSLAPALKSPNPLPQRIARLAEELENGLGLGA